MLVQVSVSVPVQVLLNITVAKLVLNIPVAEVVWQELGSYIYGYSAPLYLEIKNEYYYFA
jgi:hypothetical protein